jgi:hypothetical protein
MFESCAAQFAVFVYVDLELSVHEGLSLPGYELICRKRVDPVALGFAGWPPHTLTHYASCDVPAEPISFLHIFATNGETRLHPHTQGARQSDRPRLALLTVTADFFRFFEGACLARGIRPRALLYKPCMDGALNEDFLHPEGRLASLLSTGNLEKDADEDPTDTCNGGKLWLL